MNRRLLLHIGFHKTGTTFLQDHVFEPPNRGFSSPWSVVGGEAVEHFVLPHSGRYSAGTVKSEFVAAVAELGRDEKAVPVISHEDLCGYPAMHRYYGWDVAGRLKESFPDAQVLIGIREQKSMIRSTWGEYVRKDGEWPLEEFIGTGEDNPGFRPICRLDHFEYSLLVNRYIDLFGKENVLVLPYELLRNDAVAYEQAVHDFCGTGVTADVVHPASNVGLGALTLAIQRRLNRFAKVPPLWAGDRIALPSSYRAKMRLVRLLQRVIPSAWHDREDRKIRAYITEVVGSKFKESNRELSETCGLDLAAYGYDV